MAGLLFNKQEIVEAAAPAGRSLTKDALLRFRRNKLAMFSLLLFIFLVLASQIIPYLLPFDYEKVFWSHLKGPPLWSEGHFFGFDINGRDLFARSLYGLGVSLKVAAIATLVSVVVGVTYGAIAGYFGGYVDEVMMRFVDIMYALPYILFVILLMVMFGRNEVLLYVGIGLVEWITMARIVRGQTLSIKEKEFIEAAKASGQKSFTIIFRHIVPNLVGPVVIYATLTVPEIILTESFLSYLGFGIQEPRTSLGTLISEGTDKVGVFPWMLWYPAIILTTILFCLIFIGEGLRDAFDPKDR